MAVRRFLVRSDMNSERSELKYALSLFQFSLSLQERKGCLNLLNQRNRKCQVMMPRKDSADLVVAQAFDRAVEELRIRGGIKGVQTTLINQIAGIQVFSLRLIKTAVPGGMPRRVYDLDRPPAQIKAVSVMQD